MLNQLATADRRALVVVTAGAAMLFGFYAGGVWLGRSAAVADRQSIAPAPEPAPATVPTGWHLVEAGAYESADIAEQKVQALRRQYTSARARQEPADRLFHVYVGPYRQQADAEAVASEVRQMGFESVDVRPVTPN